MVLYINPKGELRRWDRYPVMPTASGEVAIFKDIDGDGVPDAVFSGRAARSAGPALCRGSRRSRGPFIKCRRRATGA